MKPPKYLALDYYKRLRDMFARVWASMQADLLEDVERFIRTRRDASAREIDARLADFARLFLEHFKPSRLSFLIAVAKTTSTHQREAFKKQIAKEVGVDLLITDRRLAGLLDAFVVENASLIRGAATAFTQQVERTVFDAVSRGTRFEVVAKDLQERFAVSKSRAALIARDQIGKLYGNLNEARQKDIGVKKYFWRTAKDNRVRKEHRDREGKSYAWNDPPSDGHPGQPIRCRCFAEPDLKALVSEMA